MKMVIFSTEHALRTNISIVTMWYNYDQAFLLNKFQVIDISYCLYITVRAECFIPIIYRGTVFCN